MHPGVIIFDYFGVLAHRYAQPDSTLLKFIEQHLYGKYRLAVLSNMSGGSAEEMLGDQAKLFEVVMLSSETGVSKPDTRAFIKAAEILKEFPSDCLVVDDSQANCAAAREVGMEAIYYQNIDQFEQELVKYGIITS